MVVKKSAIDTAVMNSLNATNEAIRSWEKLNPRWREIYGPNSAATKATAEVLERQRKDTTMINSLNAAHDAVKSLEKLSPHWKQEFGSGSATAKLAKQIADQQRLIEKYNVRVPALPELPDMSDYVRPSLESKLEGLEFALPPNPIHETNKRLEQIEKRFVRMEKIALNGAEIATGLQASAAQFLVKFESAAESNDKTTKRAVRIGLIAIFFAVAIPIAQTFYSDFYKAPADAAAAQALISDMKSEISKLNNTQEQTTNRLIEAISKNGDEQTKALNEIREFLSRQKAAN
jgi:hypothetical protein